MIEVHLAFKRKQTLELFEAYKKIWDILIRLARKVRAQAMYKRLFMV